MNTQAGGVLRGLACFFCLHDKLHYCTEEVPCLKENKNLAFR
jgi:hypothetical protein